MKPVTQHLPSLASLKALEALDRLGSATAAAEELNQTQSAVSRQLKSLEDALGVTLFIRKSRRLRLRPEAELYVAEIRQALTQLERAATKLAFNPGGGTVNLAILPTFGMRWLIPRLAEFAKAHPEVAINLTSRVEKVNFAAEPFDAAIYFGRGAWSGTEAMRLKPEQVIAVCAPDLADPQALKSPRDVASLPLLHIASRPDAWRAWFEARDVRDLQTSGTVYDQFSTIMQAALHGLGVALLPDYLAEADLAAGRLVPVWGGPVPSLGAYHLVYPVENARDPALSKFRTWLSDVAEDEDDPLPR